MLRTTDGALVSRGKGHPGPVVREHQRGKHETPSNIIPLFSAPSRGDRIARWMVPILVVAYIGWIVWMVAK